MIEFSPEDGAVIINTVEDESSGSVTITASSSTTGGSIVSIVDWQFLFEGEILEEPPPGLSVTDNDGSITVEYDANRLIFPIEKLSYVDDQKNRVDIFEPNVFELLPEPEKAPYVVEMRREPVSQKTWNLEVFAKNDTDSKSATFFITIIANYSITRDQLLGEINARR